MSHLLSAHLRNAGILVLAAAVAMAAERLVRADTPVGPRGRSTERLAPFLGPVAAATETPPLRLSIAADPFAQGGPIAPSAAIPAGVGSRIATQRLTAILVGENSRIAVIDDSPVAVGDILRDGARVSAIHPDRVWLVEKSGQWRVLSLTSPGP